MYITLIWYMIMHVFHIPFAEADYTYNYILLFLNMLISNELNPCQIGGIFCCVLFVDYII